MTDMHRPYGLLPEGLGSWSLTEFGAEVNHLDLEDGWDVWFLSHRH